MSCEPRRIAFIGTGIMGSAMAGHLVDAGFEVAVYNRTPAKCAPLVERGARLASDVADALVGAQVVLTMVGMPAEVEELYLAKDGIVGMAEPGAVLIDLSTSAPSLAVDIAEAAAARGLVAFDAPVTGGQKGAQEASLTMFCGADEATIAPVRPVLETMAARIFAFGKPGGGQIAKLSNQTALAGAMMGMTEALLVARRGGLDPALVLEALRTGTAASAPMDALAPRMLAGDYAPGFKIEHFVKDLDLVLDMAADHEATLPGVETARELYGILAQIGGAALGTQALDLVYADETACARAGLDWSALSEDVEPDAGRLAAAIGLASGPAAWDECFMEPDGDDFDDDEDEDDDAPRTLNVRDFYDQGLFEY